MSDTPTFAAPRPPITGGIAYALLLSGTIGAVGLAGFAPQGNLGVFLLFAGVALICCPPSVTIGMRWWVAAGALASCCALALLPARWLPFQPTWRHVLENIPAIPLPTTISPAPQETIFWLALFTLTVVVGLFMLCQPISSRALVYLVLAAVLACGVYAGLAISARLIGWHAPLAKDANLGFFPNRNHTATLLVTGSILAVSLIYIAYLSRRWFLLDLSLIALVPCTVALFCFSESRGGIIFLFVGLVLWLAGCWENRSTRRILILTASILLVASGVFLSFDSPARERFLSAIKSKPRVISGPVPTPVDFAGMAVPPLSEPVSELRLPIWRDTLQMILESPLAGTGLGTFPRVFPQYRKESLTAASAMHPESDWLMFIAEAGLPGFLCFAGLGIALTRRLILGKGHRFWPLRWGCGAAATTALLHGVVDVPAHRAALGWWVLVLAGLSLSWMRMEQGAATIQDKKAGLHRWSWQRIVFMAAGVGALTLGGMLVAAEWCNGPALPPFMVDQAPLKIFKLQEQKNYAAAEALSRRIIKLSPLFDQPYFHLGVALASQSDDENTDARVDEVFRAQRLLDPITVNVSRVQAATWAGYDPVRQAAMCLDAVARNGRIDRLSGHGSKHPFDYFGELVAASREQPDVQRYLLGVTRPDGRFANAWSTGVAAETAREQADNLAADVAFIRNLSADDRRLIRPDWYMRDERDQPQSLMPDERGSSTAGWPVRLRQMVNGGQFERAVGELSHRYGISLEVAPSSDEFGSQMLPVDMRAAYQTAWSKQDFLMARRLLKDVPIDFNNPASLELLRLQAVLAARGSDWYEAWLRLERYVQHTRQTEWP